MSDIAKELEKIAKQLGVDAPRSVIQAAKEIGTKSKTIKLWEEVFPEIKPKKIENERPIYHNKEIEILQKIKIFLEEAEIDIEDLRKICVDGYEELEEVLEKDASEFKKPNKQIEIDDFLGLEEDDVIDEFVTKEEPEEIIRDVINPQAKLIDFNIKPGEIDPIFRREMKEKISEIRDKLQILKKNLANF